MASPALHALLLRGCFGRCQMIQPSIRDGTNDNHPTATSGNDCVENKFHVFSSSARPSGHGSSGSTVTLALAFCPFSPTAVTVTTVVLRTLGATNMQVSAVIVPAVVLQVTACEHVWTGWTLVRNWNCA